MATSSTPQPYSSGFVTMVNNGTITDTYTGCFMSSALTAGQVSGSFSGSSIGDNQHCAAACYNTYFAPYAAMDINTNCVCLTSAWMPPTPSPDSHCNTVCDGTTDFQHACGGVDNTQTPANQYYSIYDVTAFNATTSGNSTNTTMSNSTVSNTTASNTTISNMTSNSTNGTGVNTTVSGNATANVTVTGNSTASVNGTNSTTMLNGTNSTTSMNGTTNVTIGSNVTIGANVTGTNVTVTGNATGNMTTNSTVGSNTTSTSTSTSTSTTTSSTPTPTVVNGNSVNFASSNSAWTFQSCWGEPQGVPAIRALGVAPIQSDNTINGCLTAATAGGFTYAGVEYGGQCWASNSAPLGGAIPSSYCNMACSGDPTGQTICGGSYTLNLYSASALSLATVQTTSQQTPVGTRTWSYQSCWGEPAQGRALANLIIQSGATVQSCTSLAASMGYGQAGLEYGGQCWAANGQIYGGQIPESYCNQPCSANNAQTCGAGYVLSLYTSNPLPKQALTVGNSYWQPYGCIGEPEPHNQNSRALTTPFSNQAWNQGTVESCLQAGQNAGFTWCGLEYGNQCWCGYNAPYGGNGAGMIPQSYCNMPCSNNNAETCGGNWALNVYQLTASW